MLHTSCSEFSVLLPSSVLSVPSSFPSLYLAPLCVPPRILSPSPSPPARSFPRTACSQHPLADWPVGIKGTVPPRSAWLYSSSATMLPSFPLLLRLLTVLYFHAASALCEGGETENTKRLSVIMLFSCCSLWQVSHLRRKRGGIRPHTRKEKRRRHAWPKQSFPFKIAEHDTLQAQQTWKAQSKPSESSQTVSKMTQTENHMC